MDLLTRFNRKNIQDRTIDTLIGLSKGLIADGKIVQEEAEFLMSWLIQNQQSIDIPVIKNLLLKVETMLEDGNLDHDESTELFSILRDFAGNTSEVGEISKTTNLPINSPQPSITFAAKSFVFTGTFAFGKRQQCMDATNSLGGRCPSKVTQSLDYLVLGYYVTDSWAHESFGRKIEAAMKLQDNGCPLVIISEEHWANEGGFS